MIPRENTALYSSQDETYGELRGLPDTELKLSIAPKDTTGKTGSTHETPVQLTNQFRGFSNRYNSRPYNAVLDDIKQQFSCVVTDIDSLSREFSARISDVTNPENPDEIVSLSFDEIQKSDQDMLSIGDSFIWYIGYQQGESISRQGFSKMRFRRLPLWSKQEIDTASTRAKELSNFFNKQPNSIP